MITFTGLQQALDEYGERTSTDTEDVDRKIAAMRVAMQVLAILRGIGADDIDAEIEEALLRPVPVDRHGEWFVTHPQMLRTAFVCDLADENELFQATFSALREPPRRHASAHAWRCPLVGRTVSSLRTSRSG